MHPHLLSVIQRTFDHTARHHFRGPMAYVHVSEYMHGQERRTWYAALPEDVNRDIEIHRGVIDASVVREFVGNT